MKIPFLDRFKKSSAPAEPVRRTAAPKTEGSRLSKTVMPNSTRAMVPGESTKDVGSMLVTETAVPAPRSVSFSPKRTSPGVRSADLPPAVALALEPRVERVVALELAEIVRQMPAGLTKPAESFEAGRRVLLKAAELEKGMGSGNPAVSLGSVYQQVPEIFLRPVPPGDCTEISLPFDKVLAAFTQMQVRRDQKAEQAVPQVSTPFLQATLEDSERFGIAAEPPIMAEAQPDVNMRVELATAKTLADAEPEPTASEKFVRVPGAASEEDEDGAADSLSVEEAPMRPGNPAAKSPERIPFHFPPKETGVSASERVPALCGPPVSNPLRSPARIPFANPSSVKQPPQDEMAAISRADERRISLPLKPILESLPVFQLTGDPKEVPETARISLSLALLQSQLASGRIAIEPEIFERSLPPETRRFFTAKDVETPVILSLQEVLQQLPPDVLRMREDQENREQGEAYVTPFSDVAAEDAERFKKSSEPIAKVPAVQSSERPPPAPSPAPLDAKSLVAQANQIPGIRACALIFADGLNLAGHLPTEIASDGLCAVAPGLLERMASHMAETKMGRLTAMTLHATKASITFFLHGNISLAALHAAGELGPAARDQLSKMLEELSQTYAQQETPHVHN